MADTVVQLKNPITVDDKEYTELVFPEKVKLGHFKMMPLNFQDKLANGEVNFGELIPIIAGLTKVSEKVIEEIDLEDMDGIVDGLKGFF